MKRFLTVLLALVFGCFLFAGCDRTGPGEGPSGPSSQGGSNYAETGGAVKSVTLMGSITGAKSKWNDTVTEALVAGTDLGIPVYDSKNDRMLLYFGDTYSGQVNGEGSGTGNWRSNVCAYSKDFDLSDGLTIDGWFTQGSRTMAREIIRSIKTDGYEITTIPTGAIEIGGNIYVFYMSVREWGANGEWWVNYCGVVKSSDGGNTYTRVEDLTWTGFKDETVVALTGLQPAEVRDRYAPGFAQIWPMRDGEYVYIYGIEGGRFGGVRLGRVKADEFEDFSAYEYYTGMQGEAPVFAAGEEGLKAVADGNASSLVIEGPAGEMCVVWNEYLQKYMTIYQEGQRMVFRSASSPWGAWSEPVKLVDYNDFNSMYCGFMHEKYMADGGKTVYFIMSYWWDYESVLMKLELA